MSFDYKVLYEMQINLKYSTKVNLKRREFIKNKIDIYKYFYDYLELIKISKKDNEKINTEQLIYKFLYENIFIYLEEFNICKPKKIITNKEILLDYIREQIFIKFRLENCNNKPMDRNNKESLIRYFEEIYISEFEFDEYFFRTKYIEVLKTKKSEKFSQFKIFPEMIHYLTMHMYKYEDNNVNCDNEKKYINEKFCNIIKQMTTNKEEEYTLKEYYEFYNNFEELLSFFKNYNYKVIKCRMFETVFKILRIGLIVDGLSKPSKNKQSKKQLLLLISALNIQSLELSMKMIGKIIKKNCKYKKQYNLILFYIQLFDIIDSLIDIVIDRKEVNYNEFINIIFKYITIQNDNKGIREWDSSSIKNNCHDKSREELFKLIKKNEMNYKRQRKISKKIYFRDFEEINKINLNKMLKLIKI